MTQESVEKLQSNLKETLIKNNQNFIDKQNIN